jgi:hypothetical protein
MTSRLDARSPQSASRDKVPRDGDGVWVGEITPKRRAANGAPVVACFGVEEGRGTALDGDGYASRIGMSIASHCIAPSSSLAGMGRLPRDQATKLDLLPLAPVLGQAVTT